MKKVGFLALALGLFVAACNSSSTSNTGDSASIDSAVNTAAPVDSAAVDTAAAAIDSAAVAPADSAK